MINGILSSSSVNLKPSLEDNISLISDLEVSPSLDKDFALSSAFSL